MLRLLEQFVAPALLDDLAGVHDRDSSAHLGDHAEIVGDQQHRHADLLLQLAHQLENLRLDRHVERGRRLVGDQQLRVADSAMAIITRWRMPPESWCGYSSTALRDGDADQRSISTARFARLARLDAAGAA